ncbi:MAG: hypothetical protein ACI4SV_01235 [Duodenibacillus sp.]
MKSSATKPIELHAAARNLSADEVLDRLSDAAYLRCLHLRRVSTQDELMARMASDGVLIKERNGRYGVTNFGALCFAQNLLSFPSLGRKALRII